MALQKQSVSVNFSKGLSTKNDPYQIQLGNFLVLQNSVFDEFNANSKRNGFGYLATLLDTSSTFLTTFNSNLTAIGSAFQAYAEGSQTWINKGKFAPLTLSTLPLVRSNLNQTQADAATSGNDLVCTAYTETDGTSTFYKYSVCDSITGQNVIAPTLIVPSSGAVTGSPKAFLLGNYFVVVFTATISAADHLQYIAININTLAINAASDITSTYTAAAGGAFDGVVANNNLYLAWNASSSGGIKITYLDSTLTQHATTVPDASHQATLVSVCADVTQSTAVVWVSYYDSSTSDGYTFAVNQQLSSILAPLQIISSETVKNITSAAQSSVNTVFYEIENSYPYAAIPSNFIKTNTITQAGSLGTASVLVRSLGLSSKACIYESTIYLAGIYSSAYQPTNFVLNGQGNIVARLAYTNSGGYLTLGLPTMQITQNEARLPYLFKDLVEAVNKDTDVPAGTQVAGVYSQTGINLGTLYFGTDALTTAEIGSDLHLTGGFLWMYDGFAPVEHNFFVWPDSIFLSPSTTGGTLAAQTYFYQVTYEWTDNQGNAFRSAPSIPVSVATTGATSSVTVSVPTLRLSYKADVKIVIYRWSTSQQVYYQVTSISAPTLNDPTTDSVSFVDTLPDATILGNNIIYTTGGQVENVGSPAFQAIALYNARLWGIDAEDGNLLWFSQPVVKGSPVEMSDLLTYYVNPSQGAQGPTGPVRCLFPLDDKFILFKKGALEYLTGLGPDLAGNNSDFPASPTFITSVVGCENQNSIVSTPKGLMFQASQGIWLLGRDLSTFYIGNPVQAVVQGTVVLSAINIPGTTQVRFTLSSGITLMYDYLYDQWGTFTGIPGISSTLYQGLHTYINSAGAAFQETPGAYLDGTNPINRGFTTAWVSLAGLQGYQRAYFFQLLGTYLSPHKLVVGVAYNFNPTITQQWIITPDNFSPAFGGETNFGSGTPFGGISDTEEWQLNFKQTTCTSFQLTFTEQYDPTVGPAAGAGFTLSALNLVVGLKKAYQRRLPARRKVG